MNALVVHNPSSKSRGKQNRFEEFEKAAGKFHLQFDRLDTLPGGKTRYHIQQALEKKYYQYIIGMGGDGTFNEIIQGIMSFLKNSNPSPERIPAFLPIPMGTGNNIAKSLQYSPLKSMEATLQRGLQGREMWMDLGVVDRIYFADSFSIGVDPAILVQRNVDREAVRKIPLLKTILRDYFLYITSAFKKVFTHSTLEATLKIDGEYVKFPDLYNLVVNNTQVYGGVFNFSKESDTQSFQDGLLDLIFFLGKNDYLSKLLLGFRLHPFREEHFQKIMVRHSQNLQAKSIEISLAHPMGSLVDGEEYLTKSVFEIQVLPKVLKVQVGKEMIASEDQTSAFLVDD